MSRETTESSSLYLKHLGIDTQRDHVIYMNENCPVCKSEGFEAQTRIQVEHRNGTLLASLNLFRDGGLLEPHEAALSENAWRDLEASEGDRVILSHPDPVESFSHVRRKIYGNEVDREALEEIIRDVVDNRYSGIQIASFLTAFGGHNLTLDEITGLTEAMIESGERLDWNVPVVGDKHSLGGLPGNRTTPIVVAIVASRGVTIPKTSSRAITSPSGTADTMEMLTRVNLNPRGIKQVVDQEGGCFVWGGGADLSPADDILIRVERVLDIDSEGQMVASILSKKAAAGSTHVVIDMPVGPTAKVRGKEAARTLEDLFGAVAEKIGLEVTILAGDGGQPIGRGIGPALEARDVLQVFRGDPDAPDDLRERSLELAGALLELVGDVDEGRGVDTAREVLDSGRARDKFEAICHAQGRFTSPPTAPHHHEITAEEAGEITAVDNRKLARLAKLAGAPGDPAAGVDYRVRLGETVAEGDVLYRVHAESQGELDYALRYAEGDDDIITVEEAYE